VLVETLEALVVVEGGVVTAGEVVVAAVVVAVVVAGALGSREAGIVTPAPKHKDIAPERAPLDKLNIMLLIDSMQGYS
jgi:hypothetical protein